MGEPPGIIPEVVVAQTLYKQQQNSREHVHDHHKAGALGRLHSPQPTAARLRMQEQTQHFLTKVKGAEAKMLVLQSEVLTRRQAVYGTQRAAERAKHDARCRAELKMWRQAIAEKRQAERPRTSDRLMPVRVYGSYEDEVRTPTPRSITHNAKRAPLRNDRALVHNHSQILRR